MSTHNQKITLNIDDQTLEVESGLTILQVAERHGIYIPTLCVHKDLPPFGACRMCIVEIEGRPNFSSSCTTPAMDGMIIKTHSDQIQAARREILQLILSEHPSSCVLCDFADCRETMNTMRKVGVTTGCRTCPKDGQCELQDLAEYLGINEINYPIHYRMLPLEKYDPFYDRDYNLCILCGRCVQACQEIRLADTLAFIMRGHDTVIGPAFGRTHMEAGCEFCGACVSVCPTGALSEKNRKWEGEAEREVITTCALCGIGCQLRLLIKRDEIIGTLPVKDPLVSNGQLCVKGRFCIPELVNNYQRLQKPNIAQNGARKDIPWVEAIELVAKKIAVCPSDQFGMLISPNCCNEDLYIAQKFTRAVTGSNNISTTASKFYGAGFNAYLRLMRIAVPLSDLQKASLVFCVGLDTRFGRSVVGVELKKAINIGAKVITIHPRNHNLAIVADKWLQPIPGTEVDILQSLADLTATDFTGSSDRLSIDEDESLSDAIYEIAESLKSASAPMILVGSEYLQYDESQKILGSIERIALNINAGMLPLPAQNNLAGSILMGAYSELLPGGFSSSNEENISVLREKWRTSIPIFSSSWNIDTLSAEINHKVLYLIGEIPFNKKPPSDFLIFQNTYPPDPFYEADLVLPSAAFTEVDGTFINEEGRIQQVNKAVQPPGEALPDWEILCRIAQKMGIKGFDYDNVIQIHEEIASLVDGFKFHDNFNRSARPLICKGELAVSQTRRASLDKVDQEYPLLLSSSIIEHTYHGFPLSVWVDGLKDLFTEATIVVNPQDAQKAGLSPDDKVMVTSAFLEKIWPIKITNNQPQGTLNIILRQGDAISPNPQRVRIRKNNV